MYDSEWRVFGFWTIVLTKGAINLREADGKNIDVQRHVEMAFYDFRMFSETQSEA